MLELCRKKPLARNLAAMAEVLPQHYDFSPRAFQLPEQYAALAAELPSIRDNQVRFCITATRLRHVKFLCFSE